MPNSPVVEFQLMEEAVLKDCRNDENLVTKALMDYAFRSGWLRGAYKSLWKDYEKLSEKLSQPKDCRSPEEKRLEVTLLAETELLGFLAHSGEE